ncbi:hypothetical protein GLP30_10870 [Photobacterium phosphoreum]|uniref:Uncharacterized protein n=1 Tax=Photobacterium phosphoreum TaxID=659 RepID=A0AAW4ZV18_PHOPO|nr:MULTISPECIES: primase-helicase family protein [Photobacterium]MCD9491322.1 hypothetical protein [Photobacterium phosphoreum]MCD9502361.1 hypothetical protein [Photobacterium phosphoreum]MCD9505660.1 hypothetical protein [Photobacterium phosphoreum]MCD9518196.1 hypothetical protein [Photobacterium phosphoreum]MCD9552188.1 hypothetical protein [Photobacterium carnosum]
MSNVTSIKDGIPLTDTEAVLKVIDKNVKEVSNSKVAYRFAKYLNDDKIMMLSEIKGGIYPTIFDTRINQDLTNQQLQNEFHRWQRTQKFSDWYKWDHVKEVVLSEMYTLIREVFDPTTTSKFVPLTGKYIARNKFRKYQPQRPPANNLTLFNEFMFRMFNDDKDRELILDWIAHLLQKPWEVRHGILCEADGGVGKGRLMDRIIKPLVIHVKKTNKWTDLNNFSTHWVDSLFLCVDDAPTPTMAQCLALKSNMLTEDLEVHRKFVQCDNGLEKTYTGIWINTNKYRFMKMDAALARRFYVPNRIEHKVDEVETQKFLLKLDDWLDDGGLEAVYDFLLKRDISKFNPFMPPNSAMKDAILNASDSQELLFIKDYVANHHVLQITTLKGIMKTEGLYADDNQIAQYLRQLDFDTPKNAVTVNKSRKRWWWKNGIENAKEATKIFLEQEPFSHNN